MVNKKEYLKMLEEAKEVKFGIKVGEVSCFVPVDKDVIKEVIEDWGDIGPLDAVWYGGNKESGIIINYGGYGDNL